MASILDIGDDVMAIIMSFIEDPEAYLAIRLVCRRLYKLSKQEDGTILTKFSRSRKIDCYQDDNIVGHESGLLWGNRLKHGIIEIKYSVPARDATCECVLREKYIMGYLMSVYFITSDKTQLIFKRVKSKGEIAQYHDYVGISLQMTAFLVNSKEKFDNLEYSMNFSTVYIYDICDQLVSGGCVINLRRDENKKLYTKLIQYPGTRDVYFYNSDGKIWAYKQFGDRKHVCILYHENGTIATKSKYINKANICRTETWKYNPNGNLVSHYYKVNDLVVFSE
jgi:hypothetical protein